MDRSQVRQGVNSAYTRLKARLCTNHYPPGTPLGADALAHDLEMGATAVREALIWLAAERLTEFDPHSGFVVKRATQSEIADLYNLNQDLLEAVAARIDRTVAASDGARLFHQARRICETDGWTSAGFAELTGRLFHAIAGRSDNAEAVYAVSGISDRLHGVRCVEWAVLPAAAAELAELCHIFYRAEPGELSGSLTAYHAYRLARIEEICDAFGKTALIAA
ncbi:GntR family transcriptional regulator [Parasphingopyxis algicola]|nr:GntR family transcriptional regulator [Parasphingopyxis algicola]QLC24899.1 GntR family transcriptional regulator [Parasphingopyxis algicola]